MNIFKLIEKLSTVYRKYFLKDFDFKSQSANNFLALKIFLNNYAYERQGVAPAYHLIATETIEKYYLGEQIKSLNELDALKLWGIYQSIARNEYKLYDENKSKIKVNEKNNPLNKNNGIVLIGDLIVKNLASQSRIALKNNKTIEIYESISKVRGIREKITSFYLRDIACLSDINENNLKDNYLLQPIDTWVEQGLEILNKRKVKFNNLNDKQKFIVDICNNNNISPISFNQGLWYFGSKIARNNKNLRKSFEDYNYALTLTNNYMQDTKYLFTVLSEILN